MFFIGSYLITNKTTLILFQNVHHYVVIILCSDKLFEMLHDTRKPYNSLHFFQTNYVGKSIIYVLFSLKMCIDILFSGLSCSNKFKKATKF